MAAPIDIPISENVSAALAELVKAAADLTPAMAEIATHLATAAKQRFAAQRSPLGVPWKQSQRAKEDGGLTLVQRAFLKNSIKEDWGSNYAAAGPENSGASAIYAAIHQFGGRIAAKAGKALRTPFGPRRAVNIPAREYLGWNPDSETRVLDILGAFLGRVLGGAAA